MTITGSDQVNMSYINIELNQAYDKVNTSLTDASTGGGTYPAINTDSPSYPDGNTPHSMSEFYSYNHDATPPFAINITVCECTTGNDFTVSGTSNGATRIGVIVAEYLLDEYQGDSSTQCAAPGGGGDWIFEDSLIYIDTDEIRVTAEVHDAASCGGSPEVSDNDSCFCGV